MLFSNSQLDELFIKYLQVLSVLRYKKIEGGGGGFLTYIMSFVKLIYEFCEFKGSYLFNNRGNHAPTVFISYYQIFQDLFSLHIEFFNVAPG